MNCTHPDCPPDSSRRAEPFPACYRVVLYVAVEGMDSLLMLSTDASICRWHRFVHPPHRHDGVTGLWDLWGDTERAELAAGLGVSVDWERSYLSYEPLGV